MKFFSTPTSLALLNVATASLFTDTVPNFPVTPSYFLKKDASTLSSLLKRDTDPTLLYPRYTFEVAIDHFHNDSRYAPHSNEMYNMSYYFDTTWYKPGGPVIILCSGEDAASDRLPYLQKGIAYELAKATNGLGVVLEHRYYGDSFPVSNLTTQSLRFLTTDQSLADTAVFAQNVVFPGLEGLNLTSAATPWIAYGGSYAGAYVAFLRKLYPDVFFGAISSSGVTKAIVDYWQYYEAPKTYGPQTCVKVVQQLTNAMDNIILKAENFHLIPMLKQVFGFNGLSHIQDMMSALQSYSFGYWQSKQWDPSMDATPYITQFCDILTNATDVYSSNATTVNHAKKILTAGGYSESMSSLTNPLLNWIGYMNEEVTGPCAEEGATADECFGSFDKGDYAANDISQTWRSWEYQVCTQWGYFQTGSGTPANQLPITSRTIDLYYASKTCQYAFGITTVPNVTAINQYGGFDISYSRLAFIGGEWDPWRPATPFAPGARPWPVNTTSEPAYLIPRAVHHWDENGLFPNETTKTLPPKRINDVHAFEVAFVKEWLSEAVGMFPRK